MPLLPEPQWHQRRQIRHPVDLQISLIPSPVTANAKNITLNLTDLR